MYTLPSVGGATIFSSPAWKSTRDVGPKVARLLPSVEVSFELKHNTPLSTAFRMWKPKLFTNSKLVL